MVSASDHVTYFYTTISFGHFTILLALFFVLSTLIFGSADAINPTPHPLTRLTRWVWRHTGSRALAGLRLRLAVWQWRRTERRHERRHRHPHPLGGETP